MGGRTIACLIFAALCQAQQLSEFAGTWVVKAGDRAVVSLTLTISGATPTCSFTLPERLTFTTDGQIESMGGEQGSAAVDKSIFTTAGWT
jgi:hypothetical protein